MLFQGRQNPYMIYFYFLILYSLYFYYTLVVLYYVSKHAKGCYLFHGAFPFAVPFVLNVFPHRFCLSGTFS